MNSGVPVGGFIRGLSDDFIEALRDLASKDSWWTDVLRDTTLIIAARDEYINVYWQGQSIFKIGYAGKRLTVNTHPKYLLDPELKEYVGLNVDQAVFDGIPDHALIRRYEGARTLIKIKSAAGLFSGNEKKGVHVIACENNNVVDVEVAIGAAGIKLERKVPRIDIAALEQRLDGIELVFWEAKLFTNKEIRSRKAAVPVVEQIREYRTVLAKSRDEILSSYQRVASNIVAIAAMSTGVRFAGPTIQAVARGSRLTMGSPPRVGLIIFGFDSDQRDSEMWKETHLPKLLSAVGAGLVRTRGDPKGLML
jgi:hypothetical protein